MTFKVRTFVAHVRSLLTDVRPVALLPRGRTFGRGTTYDVSPLSQAQALLNAYKEPTT